MKRWISTRPAHDCMRIQPCKFGVETCTAGGNGRHGIHSVDMAWYVSEETPKGTAAVQFLLFTGWLLDETYASMEREQLRPSYDGKFYNPLTPIAADLGFHSPYPVDDYLKDYARDSCTVITAPCYYDGSSLNAEEPWRLLRYEGDEALWVFLEAYWARMFAEALLT